MEIIPGCNLDPVMLCAPALRKTAPCFDGPHCEARGALGNVRLLLRLQRVEMTRGRGDVVSESSRFIARSPAVSAAFAAHRTLEAKLPGHPPPPQAYPPLGHLSILDARCPIRSFLSGPP
jgi:hypothetical protein